MTKSNRKVNTRPVKSIMDCVKEFASANKTFTLKQVYEAYPDKSKPQMQTALWKLGKAGGITKAEDGTYTVLTDVNKPVEVKPVEVKPQTPKKRRAYKTSKKLTIEELQRRLQEASKEILYWNKMAKDMANKAMLADKLTTQHEDALAIIRYLENKLYVALQMVAKNGGNS